MKISRAPQKDHSEMPTGPCVLTVNGGSSSIRFAIYEIGSALGLVLDGKIDRLGRDGTNFTFIDASGRSQQGHHFASLDYRGAARYLFDWLEAHPVFPSIRGVGHRVVHGMKHAEPEVVTPKLLSELRRLTPYDPDHLPQEIQLIEIFRKRHPKIPQVACFDTAFHRTMPLVAKLLPIPRRYSVKGVQRYGFHGLSYSYLMEELHRLDPVAAKGRVILAHLGSGASLAAVQNGKSIDTSMGFTPTSGLVMSTRTGDLDPGLAYYLSRTERMTASQFQRMVNHKSGLLGVSGLSSDLRDLCAQQTTHSRAAEAVELFCYQVKKWIGSFAAALGGLDTLIFSAGIGENAPLIRQRICDGLGFLGIELNARSNAKNLAVISKDNTSVRVRVIRTNEESMIARFVVRILHLCPP